MRPVGFSNRCMVSLLEWRNEPISQQFDWPCSAMLREAHEDLEQVKAKIEHLSLTSGELVHERKWGRILVTEALLPVLVVSAVVEFVASWFLIVGASLCYPVTHTLLKFCYSYSSNCSSTIERLIKNLFENPFCLWANTSTDHGYYPEYSVQLQGSSCCKKHNEYEVVVREGRITQVLARYGKSSE